MSKFRGYDIKKVDGEFVFCDTGLSTVKTWQNRPCGHCGLFNTKEGHDGCLGTLPEVMNACCGHGEINEAYIQYKSGEIFRGMEAISRFGTLVQLAETTDLKSV